MEQRVTVSRRGSITIPKKMREILGFQRGNILLIKQTQGGLLLTPAEAFPVEIYTDERIAEFKKEELDLTKALKLRMPTKYPHTNKMP